MPRLDWRNAALGAFLGAVVQGILPGEVVREVLSMTFRALGALFGHDVPGLPMKAWRRAERLGRFPRPGHFSLFAHPGSGSPHPDEVCIGDLGVLARPAGRSFAPQTSAEPRRARPSRAPPG
jgi:hypothetical protein